MHTGTKYFGIGYPKTGTTSLCGCFKRLGYRECKIFPYFLEWWQTHDDVREIVDDARFLEAVEQHDMFSDWPFFYVYRELDQRFPGSKFILTVRASEEVWQASEDRMRELRKTQHDEAGLAEYWRQREGLPTYDYQGHIEEVKKYFEGRPDDLLIMCFETGDGWDKLCSFLGVPVPDKPLPFLNRAVEPLTSRVTKSARKRVRAVRNLFR